MSNAVRLRLGFAPLALGMLESTGWADTACWTDAIGWARVYRVMQKARSAQIRAIVACVGIRALYIHGADIEPKEMRIFLVLTCWSLW